MSTYIEHYSISSHDVDINNNIKPSSFARLMQETGNHNMRDRRPTYEELFDNGQSFIATRILYEVIMKSMYIPGRRQERRQPLSDVF